MITKDTPLGEIIKNEKAAKIIMDAGLHCASCPMAQMETLEQGAKGHGMSDKDVKELVEKINKTVDEDTN